MAGIIKKMNTERMKYLRKVAIAKKIGLSPWTVGITTAGLGIWLFNNATNGSKTQNQNNY